MTRSVLYPRLGLAVGERHGDERGSRVVGADLLASIGTLEEDAARDASRDEMLAVLRGGVVDIDLFAVQVDEDEVAVHGRDAVVGEEHAPCTEATRDAR